MSGSPNEHNNEGENTGKKKQDRKDFDFECANYIHTIITKELDLINSRMTWLLVSETFLIAAYATLINDFEPLYYKLINKFLITLPIIGSLLSFFSLMAILSADTVATYLGCREGHIMKSVNPIYKKKIARVSSYKFRQKKIRWTILAGSIPNFMIPLIISLFWGIVSLYTRVLKKCNMNENKCNLEGQCLYLEEKCFCAYHQWGTVTATVICIGVLLISLIFIVWYLREIKEIRKKFEQNNIA